MTAGVTFVLTVIVMELLVAVNGEAHERLLVSTQVITSLLARVPVEYVLLLVPTFDPFFFH